MRAQSGPAGRPTRTMRLSISHHHFDGAAAELLLLRPYRNDRGQIVTIHKISCAADPHVRTTAASEQDVGHASALKEAPARSATSGAAARFSGGGRESSLFV